ncbi:MAG: hypothetical protein AAF583_08135 [Pseudomonadota bacterium]
MKPETAITLDDGNTCLNRMMLGLVCIAIAGFALVSLSGLVKIQDLPLITHVHAVVMSVWLILIAVQSHLGDSGNIALHKSLGKLGALLAILVVVTGLMLNFYLLGSGRLPPIFSPGYFLMLGIANLSGFTVFVGAALIMRKNIAWHRRLMLGALIMIFEPVLGRILPFFVIPILGGGPENALSLLMENREMLEIIRLVTHLSIVTAMMLGDRFATGRFHPVYAYIFAGVMCLHAVVDGVGGLSIVSDVANSLAGTEALMTATTN